MSSYKIADIEGIGAKYAKELEKVGIKTTEALLKKCGTAKGRKTVSEPCKLTEKQLLEFANRADLMRVKGIGSEYSDLLEAGGVDTVKELKTRRADNLTAKLAEVNEKKKLVRRVPTETEVARWIAHAKTLKARISH